MADILIRGISLPEDELKYVSLWVYGDGRVYVINNASAACSRKLQDLAVPLPEGHGRLGDLDALMPDFVKARWEFFSDGDTFLRLLKNAPTIVPAEGGKIE